MRCTPRFRTPPFPTQADRHVVPRARRTKPTGQMAGSEQRSFAHKQQATRRPWGAAYSQACTVRRTIYKRNKEGQAHTTSRRQWESAQSRTSERDGDQQRSASDIPSVRRRRATQGYPTFLQPMQELPCSSSPFECHSSALSIPPAGEPSTFPVSPSLPIRGADVQANAGSPCVPPCRTVFTAATTSFQVAREAASFLWPCFVRW